MPSCYRPDIHTFEHIATAPWPIMLTEYEQLDWVNATECMESWLNRYVGTHHSEWAYHTGTSYDYWQACVAFRWAKHKTLFLLQWT